MSHKVPVPGVGGGCGVAGAGGVAGDSTESGADDLCRSDQPRPCACILIGIPRICGIPGGVISAREEFAEVVIGVWGSEAVLEANICGDWTIGCIEREC